MGVAPALPLSAFYISCGNVHAANIPYPSVNDTELAVVAVVHLAGEGWELDGHEGMHLNAGIAQTLEETAFDIPTAHIIVDDAHLYATTGLADEGVGYEMTQSVVIEDIGVEMNVVTGLADVVQQGTEKVVTVGEDVGLVVLERQGPVLGGKKLYQRLVVVGNHQVFLLDKLEHGALGELVEALLTDETLLAGVLPEKEIEDDAQQGQEGEHQHPGHGLGGLTVVHEHPDHGTYDGKAVDKQDKPVNVYHTTMLFPSFLASVLRMFCISLYCSISDKSCCGLFMASEIDCFSSRRRASA